MTSPITPSNGSCRGLLLTPGSSVLKTPLSDETIWKRLKKRMDLMKNLLKEEIRLLLLPILPNLKPRFAFFLLFFFFYLFIGAFI
jgi:hypothetical protein